MGGQFHSREVGGQALSVSDLEHQRFSDKRDDHHWKQNSEGKPSHGAVVQGLKAQFEKQRVGDENPNDHTLLSGQISLDHSTQPPSDFPELNIGDRVVISGQEHGVLRYLGPAHFQVNK